MTAAPEMIPVPTGRTQRSVLAAIDWYQHAFSGRVSPCRFFPSCSSYSREAFEIHGARRGAWLTVCRLVRCRPFGPSGFDPVPNAEGCATRPDHSHRTAPSHPEDR